MRTDNSQYDGQAHAPTGELGSEKRVEDLLDIPFRDPAARIRHFHAGIGNAPRAPVDGETMRGGDIRGGDRIDGQHQGAPIVANGLPGIACQVGKNLVNLACV